ncbi:DUF6933 domain-containing protein [Companilactobacillus mishanensis]|uniref:DUF6933 domain-containing protein n=1 Tax=Companilactobacillus mishanensis TaxID=2486008 RepID=A0ABW9P913_9LACO|nr:hypothetical protein [Companilactobacillus mishanensis]MQS45768.1 hypothetical protein [Companilactobacillus mishanensis]
MFIKPTKKAKPIFNHLPEVSINSNEEINPLFTWHASYATMDRKKIVFIVNASTYAPIVLYDINAQKKKNIQQEIYDGMFRLFDDLFLPKETFDNYMKAAGEIVLLENGPYNRRVSGATVNMISMGSNFSNLINPSFTYQAVFSQKVGDIPFQFHDKKNPFPLKRFTEEMEAFK